MSHESDTSNEPGTPIRPVRVRAAQAAPGRARVPVVLRETEIGQGNGKTVARPGAVK